MCHTWSISSLCVVETIIVLVESDILMAFDSFLLLIMSIITTFEDQCRSLTSASSPDENASRFFVGTQSSTGENLIYLFEYKDDNNNLAKVSCKFPFGECWHLATSNKHPNLLTVVTSLGGKQKISLFKLPQELENPIEDDYGLSESSIENIFDVVTAGRNLTRQCHWHPDEGDRLLTCNDSIIEFWDIDQKQKLQEFSILKALESSDRLQSNSKLPPVADLRWSSLFNCSVVATAIGSKIYGIDTRISDSSPSSICWLIEDVKCNRIRSIDFNPNSQYYLASGGDDCRANFWDLRKTNTPALHLQTHTHWIWSIRYNPFHDQLVLSAGSDARVALMRVQSIASEPFGQMTDYDEEIGDPLNEADNQSIDSQKIKGENFSEDAPKDKSDDRDQNDASNKEPKQLDDEVIKVYEEHDDSVYAAEWASDPWIFASLGFESRLVINKVPKAEKFSILF